MTRLNRDAGSHFETDDLVLTWLAHKENGARNDSRVSEPYDALAAEVGRHDERDRGQVPSFGVGQREVEAQLADQVERVGHRQRYQILNGRRAAEI